jgi:hypothetical protein
MTRCLLSRHRCPVCGGIISQVAVDEDKIKGAPRIPVLVPAFCDQGCFLVLFVDRNLVIREAQPALQTTNSDTLGRQESG